MAQAASNRLNGSGDSRRCRRVGRAADAFDPGIGQPVERGGTFLRVGRIQRFDVSCQVDPYSVSELLPWTSSMEDPTP